MDDPELAAAVWDLNTLIDGGDGGAQRVLDEASERASAFAETYSGRVADLDADRLVTATTEFAAIRELSKLAQSYGFLRFSADTADEQAATLSARAEAGNAEVTARVLFFELEWVALGDDRAESLLAEAGERLAFAAHHLRRLRARRPHMLSQAEERVLAETSVPRLAAWKRLYMEAVGALAFELDGETLSVNAASTELYGPDRERRLAVMDGLGTVLQTGLGPRVAAYNAVLGERAIDDRLRGYPTWLSAINLLNEVSDASVAAQLAAVRSRHDIPRRWHRLKARLLGLERIATSDLRAPVSADEPRMSYGEARELVVSAYAGLSPVAGEIAQAFFTDERIDAPIRPAKQGGAFCDPVVPSRHPYVLTNFGSLTSSALHIAHELGHGLHFELSRHQGVLQQVSTIPLGEVPSTFGEALVIERLLAQASSDRERLELLSANLGDALQNVFEGAAHNRFEELTHTRLRERGDLTADDYTETWVESVVEVWDDTVEIEPGYGLQWSWMPHMIWEPGYVYAYSYALLLSLSAFDRYKRAGDEFVDGYMAMLSAGGSRGPDELTAMIGLDLSDPGLWDAGLELLDARLREAERLAESLG